MIATPISANTASHIVATPKEPRSMKTPFISITKIIFCHTIFLVFFAIFKSKVVFDGLSVVITISEFSIAMSEPIPPIDIPISALLGDGVDILLRELWEILPEGPKYFPSDMVTDLPERFLVAELIREKVFQLTRQEIPYATAVVVEEFQEKEEKNLIVLKATIQVERESQKGIIIGEKGRMLKEIGQRAREEIEVLLGAKVFLELWVKVEKNWREDPRALRRLGLI